ncbi:MAG: phosphotransferase [Pseudomonadales bacterium]|nr:phosphotransferase [Pseudomonadales bacterium]
MTQVTNDDVENQVALFEKIARTALEQWDINGQTVDITLLKYRENGVFAIRTNDAKYALRIHRPGYHSVDALRSELQWMDALKQAGISVPIVLPTTAGTIFATVESDDLSQPHHVDLFEWIDGENMDVVVERIGGDTAAVTTLYRQVGRIAAQIHNQATAWTLPEQFTRHAWDAEGLTGNNPFWGRFWDLPLLTDDQRALLQKARAQVHRDLLAFGQSCDRYSLIHADFDQANLMVNGNTLQVIDFDDAGFGWHLFELATALYFLQNEPFYDVVKEALIAGYRENRELSDEHLSHLPLFMTARSFTYLGWIHTRPETETAQQMGPLLIEMACNASTDYLESAVNAD